MTSPQPPMDPRERIFTAAMDESRHQDAVAALVEGYGDEVLRFLHGFLRDAEAADEVFAQLCLRLCEEIDRFRGECSGRTWFYYKARYMALDWRRSRARRREQPMHTEDWSRVSKLANQIRSRTRPYLRTEVKDRFSALRRQLNEEEQTLLVLYKYQRMNSQQVAEAMSTPDDPWTPQKVRKRWQRLKTHIAELATQHGLLNTD